MILPKHFYNLGYSWDQDLPATFDISINNKICISNTFWFVLCTWNFIYMKIYPIFCLSSLYRLSLIDV